MQTLAGLRSGRSAEVAIEEVREGATEEAFKVGAQDAPESATQDVTPCGCC